MSGFKKYQILFDFTIDYSPSGKYITIDNEKGIKGKIREGEILKIKTSAGDYVFNYDEIVKYCKS